MNSRSHPKGFTLVELLIAIAILAFMSVGIYQATYSSFKTRDKVIVDGDFYSEIRMAMNILDQDLTSVYSPSLRVSKSGPPQDFTASYGVTANDSSAFWGPVVSVQGTRLSRFVGTADAIQFLSSNHQRSYQDTFESIFSKIRYELVREDTPGQSGTLFKLVKHENTNAFALDEDERYGHRKYNLLGGIKKLSYRYYKNDVQRWSSNWDSGRPETKDIFPDLIEAELEVTNGEQLNFTGRFRFKIETALKELYATF